MNNYPKKVDLAMRSYYELIKDDHFDKNDSYIVEGKPKMCWECEKKHEHGYMVKDISKGRRIFFCKDCFNKLS